MTTTGGATDTADTRTRAHPSAAGVPVPSNFWAVGKARTAAIVVGALAVIAALLWSGAHFEITGSPIADPPERVVLVGVPNMGLDDLDSQALPTLRRLAADGAVAATNVRTLSSQPSTAEAFATIGAGARVAVVPELADRAYPPEANLVGGTAAEVLSRRVGEPVTGAVVVPAMPSIMAEAGDHVTSLPGTLATMLADVGVRTAVVSNADRTALDDSPLTSRPAALAVTDQRGVIPVGTVNPDVLLDDDVTAPYGYHASVDSYVEQTVAALDDADVVAVDLGDTSRAATYAAIAAPLVGETARQAALEGIDTYLERLVPHLDDRTMLLIVGVTPPTLSWNLTPTIAYGAGIPPGTLNSPAVKREGLVALTDIAPTLLEWFGADANAVGLVGQPLQVRTEAPDYEQLTELNEHAGSREVVYFPMVVTFIVLQAVVYLAAALLLSQGVGGRAASWLRVAVLTCAAWPLATFLERAVPGIEHAGAFRHAIVWSLAIAVAAVASRSRRGALSPLAWIAGATVALLVLDVATGANLQMSSILGYSPHVAARYTGFGNTAFAVLAASAVIAVAVYVHHAARKAEAVLIAAAVLAVVVLADIWPTLGSDVGGVLTLVPIFALLIYALAGRRLTWRALVIVGAATVAVLAIVTTIDLLRPEASRTHLGRYVSDAFRDGDFWTTIERKWAVNMRVFGSIWTWVVPITAAFMIYVLVLRDGWRRLVPVGSALRAGLLALVGAGVLGWLVNDSGVIITALVFVYVGPYLTLLALRDDAPLTPAEAFDQHGSTARLRVGKT
jgi:hypothetical protein